MNFLDISNQITSTILQYSNILLYIKGSPDPDVIASSFALNIICDELGVKSKIVASLGTSLPQNKAVVNGLNIPIHFEKNIHGISNFDAYCIVDHPSAYVEGLSENCRCAIHIDHHEPIEEKVEVDVKFVTDKAGSVSTIMALILKELNLISNETLKKKIATALLYGVQTDTNDFQHATHLDYEALNYLSHYSDRKIIHKITDLPLSKQANELIDTAIKNQIIYKDWLITGVGLLNETLRDNIAIIADLLLSRESIKTSVVFAIIEKKSLKSLTLDVSLRTTDENLNLNEFIKNITKEGGARKFKGAYQVPLDYFSNCPDKGLLWNLSQATTIEVIKKQIDIIPFIELKNMFNNFKEKVGVFFGKKLTKKKQRGLH